MSSFYSHSNQKSSTSHGTMTSHCYINADQASENYSGQRQRTNVLSSELFSVNRRKNSITCSNVLDASQSLLPSQEFSFNSIIEGSFDFSVNGYNTIIAPLVQQTLKGESALAILCGPESMDMTQYLISQTDTQGLVGQAATQLLNVVNQEGKKAGIVTFSWYTIDAASTTAGNSSSEAITDILKASSNNDHQHNQGQNLVLRELGKGRGMYVPGLWEVEIANGTDAEAVIQHVLSTNATSIRNHKLGQVHTVIQLTVNRSSGSEHNGTGFATQNKTHDPSSLGRLSFVLLSSLSPLSGSASIAAAAAATTGALRGAPTGLYSWVGQLSAVIDWVDSRRASPPFHKSRLLLLLRDAICGRQHSAVLTMLNDIPTVGMEALQIAFQWLKLSSQISRDPATITNNTINNNNTNNNNNNIISSNVVTHVNANKNQSTVKPNNASSHANSGTGNIIGVDRVSLRDALSLQTNVPSSVATTAANNLAQSQKGKINKDEMEMVLTSALESNREETEKLRKAYVAATQRAAEYEDAYNSIIEQLKEDGAMLAKRDQERYRRAMQDLRDYDIFKEVMETAMVKLQNELTEVVTENQELKNFRVAQDLSQRKQKSQSEKYTKDLSVTKKKLIECEQRIEIMDKDLKRATKDRDAAVATLANIKADIAKREGQLKTEKEGKERDLKDAEKRITLLEDKLRLLQGEKVAMETVTSQELSQLRGAHSKALEMLLKYQEENDILRATVSELMEQGGQKK